MVITGMRGYGKSTFFKQLSKGIEYFIVWDTLMEHGDLGVCTNRIEDITQENLKHFKKIVFQNPDTSLSFFEEFIKAVWENLNNCVVVIEEIDLYANNHYMPDALEKIIKIGRHKGIGLIGITRRIADTSKVLVSQSNYIITFKQWLPQDVDYLKQFVLVNEDVIRNLGKHEYIAYHSGNIFKGKNLIK